MEQSSDFLIFNIYFISLCTFLTYFVKVVTLAIYKHDCREIFNFKFSDCLRTQIVICRQLRLFLSTVQSMHPHRRLRQDTQLILRFIASTTSLLLAPLPIIQPRPLSKSIGVYASILPAVVGPQEPITSPGFAGHGPA